MAISFMDGPGFRGIAPDEMRRLADRCVAASQHLALLINEAVLIGASVGEPRVGPVGDEATRLSGDLARWSADLVGRAATIEAGQSDGSWTAAVRVTRAVIGVFSASADEDVAATVKAIEEWLREDLFDWDVTGNDLTNIAAALAGLDGPARRAVLSSLGTEQVAHWLRELARQPLSDVERAAHLSLIIGAIDVGSLAQVVETSASEWGAEFAAAVGDITGRIRPGSDVARFVHALVPRLDEGQWAAAVVVANAVSRTAPGAHVAVVAADLTSRPGVLGLVLRAGAHAWLAPATPTLTTASSFEPGQGSERPFDRIAALLASLDDATIAAEVVVVMMRDAGETLDSAWMKSLDEAITEMIWESNGAVIRVLGADLDPDGRILVPWVRRLSETDGGAAQLSVVVTSLLGEGPVDAEWLATLDADGAYTNARTAGYLGGVLEMAATLEAEEAHGTIADLGFLAGVAEALASAATKVAAAVTALLPAGLDLSVDGHSRSIDGRIDGDLFQLRYAIDDRFRPVLATDGSGPLGAWFALEDRWHELLAAWLVE